MVVLCMTVALWTPSVSVKVAAGGVACRRWCVRGVLAERNLVLEKGNRYRRLCRDRYMGCAYVCC